MPAAIPISEAKGRLAEVVRTVHSTPRLPEDAGSRIHRFDHKHRHQEDRKRQS